MAVIEKLIYLRDRHYIPMRDWKTYTLQKKMKQISNTYSNLHGSKYYEENENKIKIEEVTMSVRRGQIEIVCQGRAQVKSAI